MIYSVSKFLILGLFYIHSAMAAPTTISCKIHGINSISNEYQTLLENDFVINTDEIRFEPEQNDSCRPFGIKSPTLQSSKGGLSIQISAWKCGSNKPYYFQKTTILRSAMSPFALPPIVVGFQGKYSRISFNEDGTSFNPNVIKFPENEGLIPDRIIILPEGSFEFLYSDCEIKDPTNKAIH